MRIDADRFTVIAESSGVHYYGHDGSHVATIGVDTAVDLVAATDAALGHLGRQSMEADARAWEARAESRMGGIKVAVVAGLLGWGVATCLVVALLRLM